ncbi:S1C family serine protease [Phycicoccus sp. Root101]|uniref:S1C family serine protease n=1 Tax=Phycicoccus sp. Root101 TaxID=1736421 RepID=UPI001F453CCA|nr:trypsin-like peptidase domain-containing protein [Phycicoccus sp. Root101]
MDRVQSPLVVDTPSGPVSDVAPPAGRSRPARRLIVLAAVLAVVVAAGTGFALTRGPDVPPLTQADVQKQVEKGIADAQENARKAPTDAATAYRAALPSLVTITTTGVGAKGSQNGTGAGVVVSAEGTILTALHVVDGADTIRVQFTDGTRASASIKEQEAASDTAVLTPDTLPQVVVPAVLGGGAQVGDEVFPLGHPLGLTQSLSGGLVSALDRSISVGSGQTLKGLIQFDAAVNPGNSGGPLLNRDGQVIGIVTGLANPSEQNFFVGIGFAVPIATAGGVAGSPPQ